MPLDITSTKELSKGQKKERTLIDCPLHICSAHLRLLVLMVKAEVCRVKWEREVHTVDCDSQDERLGLSSDLVGNSTLIASSVCHKGFRDVEDVLNLVWES